MTANPEYSRILFSPLSIAPTVDAYGLAGFPDGHRTWREEPWRSYAPEKCASDLRSITCIDQTDTLSQERLKSFKDMIFNQGLLSKELKLIHSIHVEQYKYNYKNGPFLCIEHTNKQGEDKNTACTFSILGESSVMFKTLYSLSRFVYDNKVSVFLHIRNNIWNEYDIISRFSSTELSGIEVQIGYVD
ncbi:hypothetical protein BTN49_0441 [Candidatus Enterovibrio escicola]|uniref:Uncharacterized protein n=2 Tax=Candidatus Enterovibrio escicola TaxID=1927127 RepID=A0A2A5T5Q3_9GAMM|nr:hypothetical protein BTN49_0441 [Candidatus Enterovibrio escacola]